MYELRIITVHHLVQEDSRECVTEAIETTDVTCHTIYASANRYGKHLS